MKKILTSAGLIAVGAVTLQAQYAPAPELGSTQTTKPWSVSATLRGFYDDNYSTLPKHASPGYPTKRESFGFEVSPSIGFNFTFPQTYIGLNYTYGMRFYEDRDDDRIDQSHQVSAKLSHAFTERIKLDVSDNFVVAQEPELLNPGSAPTALPLRADGSNIRNTAAINLTTEFTEQFGAVFGYSNNFYDYDQTGAGSYSALLDRMEHQGILNLRWQIRPTTVGILGYQYGITDYTSDEALATFGPSSTLTSSTRDAKSHTVYVGADQAINPQLNASVRVGAQFTEYENSVGNSPDDSVNPYADANVTYTYREASYAQLGVTHRRNATDILGSAMFGTPNIVMDQESTLVYTSVNHRINKFIASLLGQYQHSTFEGGVSDGDAENYWTAGLNLTYEINKFLAAEAGYNYDRLDSDLSDRSYTRNRIYIGVRASY